MKKILKALLAIVLAGAVVAAGVGVGYLIKEKGLFNSADEQINNEQPADENKEPINVEKIYTDYLNSAEAEKYYHLLEDDGTEGFEYIGEKEFEFFDIDSDGVSECLVRVKYAVAEENELSHHNNEEQICLFDIDGVNVRFVMSTGLCAPYRTGEKLRLIKTENDTYKIFRYIREANKILEGTVYSYDGKNVKTEKSFFADIYPFIYDEKTFFVSSTSDLFDETSVNYADYETAEKVTEDEFYEQWDYYESLANASFSSPEHNEPA